MLVENFFFLCTSSESRKQESDVALPRADGFIRLQKLFPVQKEKTYEDAKSNSADGSDDGGSCTNNDGNAGGMLPFCRLLCVV